MTGTVSSCGATSVGAVTATILKAFFDESRARQVTEVSRRTGRQLGIKDGMRVPSESRTALGVGPPGAPSAGRRAGIRLRLCLSRAAVIVMLEQIGNITHQHLSRLARAGAPSAAAMSTRGSPARRSRSSCWHRRRSRCRNRCTDFRPRRLLCVMTEFMFKADEGPPGSCWPSARRSLPGPPAVEDAMQLFCMLGKMPNQILRLGELSWVGHFNSLTCMKSPQ